jgi:hypothetical protein
MTTTNHRHNHSKRKTEHHTIHAEIKDKKRDDINKIYEVLQTKKHFHITNPLTLLDSNSYYSYGTIAISGNDIVYTLNGDLKFGCFMSNVAHNTRINFSKIISTGDTNRIIHIVAPNNTFIEAQIVDQKDVEIQVRTAANDVHAIDDKSDKFVEKSKFKITRKAIKDFLTKLSMKLSFCHICSQINGCDESCGIMKNMLTNYKGDFGKYNETKCAICLESMNSLEFIVNTPCNHLFHMKCISCVKTQKRLISSYDDDYVEFVYIPCPICKAEVSNVRTSVKTFQCFDT